jgi:hypothetical protein
MILAFALASASVQEQVPTVRKVAQNFKCQLRMSAGKDIVLFGSYEIREAAPVGRGSIRVQVQATDKKWLFINADTRGDFRTGPDWIRVMTDFTDPNINQNTNLGALDDQTYTLDLNFPATVQEHRGRLGFATLRDQKDETPTRWESRPYPIVAIGPCDIAPRKEASQ